MIKRTPLKQTNKQPLEIQLGHTSLSLFFPPSFPYPQLQKLNTCQIFLFPFISLTCQRNKVRSDYQLYFFNRQKSVIESNSSAILQTGAVSDWLSKARLEERCWYSVSESTSFTVHRSFLIFPEMQKATPVTLVSFFWMNRNVFYF